MLDKYDLDYLKENRKLTKQQQQEIKELILKELVNKSCAEYIIAKCNLNKIKYLKISQFINKLSRKFKSFYSLRYGYKYYFIEEIRLFIYHQDMFCN